MVIRTDFNKLAHLIAVADCESFSIASERLNLTQPALSRSVAESERRIGIKIFDRRKAGVIPTAAGEAVLAEARRLLQHAEGFERTVGLVARGELGRVGLSLAPVIASIALAPLAARMLAKWPRIELAPSISVPDQAIRDLRSGLIEIALLPVDLRVSIGEDLIVEPLFDLDVSVIVRQGHPLTQPSCDKEIWDFKVALGGPQLLPPTNSGAIVCNNFDILKRITLDSDAVWFSAPLVAEEEIASGKLVKLSRLSPAFHFAIVYKRDLDSQPAETLIHETRALFAKAGTDPALS